MTEAIVHPVLSATTVSEQSRDTVQGVKEFYERNHVAISVALIIGVGMFINRALLRRELTRLKFAVEVFTDGDLVDLKQYDYIDTE